MWDGTPLKPVPFLSLDTETEYLDDGADPSVRSRTPRLALAIASDGRRTIIIRPEDVRTFVFRHQKAQWVFWNVGFDFWVMVDHLEKGPVHWKQAASIMWDMAKEGRLHDLMLLDTLVRLSDPRSTSRPDQWARGLDEASMEYAPHLPIPDKQSPYRTRFGELIGTDLKKADPKFLDYAALDALATYEIAVPLFDKASKLYSKYKTPDAVEDTAKWGLMTHRLQTWASIALSKITRNGMALDVTKIDGALDRLNEDMTGHVNWLRANHEQVLSPYKSAHFIIKMGPLKLTKKGRPKLQDKHVRVVLGGIATERKLKPPRTTKTNEISISLEWWREAAPDHPFVDHWSKLVDTCKLRQFVVGLKGKEAIYPRYIPLVRTGRTSARDPNIQQMPREPWFRELFKARDGHVLVVADYSAIELRTLAAVLLKRFGKSQLAEVIESGIDPHVHTAAMVNGMTYGEFQALEKTDKSRWKRERQAAKAVNFGVPGGLMPAGLATYASVSYGVYMTHVEAKALRDKMIYEVYPEIGEYLNDDSMSALAEALGCRVSQLWSRLDWTGEKPGWLSRAIQKIVVGNTKKIDGTDMSARFVDKVWTTLQALNQSKDPFLKGAFLTRAPSMDLGRQLFSTRVCTLTGRIRSGVTFAESRNTPFQGLAADGAKNAIWKLTLAGYRIVAFVHDECVVEVPEDGSEESAKDIKRIMEEAMSDVLGGVVPISVSYEVSDRWTKP